ncbi:MAG: valine--tRNA ligase [Taibaiella sp.]|nr:valine--tRNA ligase [Taibaiella sp.]
MSLTKTFEFSAAEEKWYQYWNDKGLFHSTPDDRPAYSIVIPPPNVTGVLHMGHALNNTVQDILIRRAKSKGYNTCWVPGTDHASIATEAKVVAMLKEKGINKNDLSREEFLQHAWEWKEKYGGVILQQLKKLGCSLDWDRVHFTMDNDYYQTVLKVFVDLYNKGKIYRGVKMINWDPQALTALSDEEVVFKETHSRLTYLRYKIDTEDDEEEYITIATVRPETIMGDTAICVHPEDPRYAHLRGKYAYVPLIHRRIPVIFDDYIDMEFGTGALKVTPAHDINDYNLGQKHRLEVVDVLNDNGTMSEAAQIYVGEDRFAVRKKIIADLEAAGHLVRQEEYKNQVGISERTGAVIEPRLSMQWWCRMDEMAVPALNAVLDDTVAFFPPKFKNLYKHWMTHIKDWCISRQLWWGQQIPAWYDTEGNIYVAVNEAEAFAQYREKNPGGTLKDLKREEDVLDTWFSSWLWPFQVFGWNMEGTNQELAYYYPTQTLVTAPDIIFFWVARMIMAGYEYFNERPFHKVYFTGLIRDKQGRKMSKQLGNSPDLLQLIADHGADTVRFSVLISSPAGNDILYDESFLEQGRNFINKMWNALKLIKIWEEKTDTEDNSLSFASRWMREKMNKTYLEVEALFEDFKLSEALKTIYSLIWNDYCSWYLEWIKPGAEEKISQGDYQEAVQLYRELMGMLHPFMPFVTEEIYQQLDTGDKSIMENITLLPEAGDTEILRDGELLCQMITAVRDIRNKQQLKPKDTIRLYFDSANEIFYKMMSPVLSKQINATGICKLNGENTAAMHALVVDKEKLFIESNVTVDKDQQVQQLEKDLEYLRGFLASIEQKLSNERFVSNAKPEIVANEQKKKEDALAKIRALEQSLKQLADV